VRNYLLLLLVGFCCSTLNAQVRTISGYIRDQANGESLIGATVFEKKLGKGTITNNFGFYSFTVKGDSAVLTYSFVGYTSKAVSLRLKSDTTIVVLLEGGRLLDEVTVRSERSEKIHETSRTGTVNLPVAQIKNVPTFAGEQDVLKALQLIPGVSGGTEGSSNILVRGGTADQTLILMDGVPIYNPTHLYGLFSSFNPDAVNNVELVKSGFPARYGGRLSGIADITLREGNSNRFSAQASVGLLASRLLLEGPIIKGRTSFLISSRASYLTLMRPLLEEKVGEASLDGYKFHDINAKINHHINSRNRVYASLYTGADKMTSKYTSITKDSLAPDNIVNSTNVTRDAMGWRNLLTSLRWNHEINSTKFFNITAYLSDYDLIIQNQYSKHSIHDPSGAEEDFGLKYKYISKIRDLGMKIDFDHIPNTKHYFRYGAAFIHHDFSPAIGAKHSTDSVFTVDPRNVRTTTNELNAYVEDDYNVTSKLKMNAGVHGVMYSVSGTVYTGLQPRLSMRYSLQNNLSLKASYSYMQQFLQTLTNAGLGMPIELWVPATNKIKPQNSHQFSIGAAQTRNNDVEISVEAFYKTMNNLLEYKEGASYLDNDQPWYDKIETGRGKAYGLEVFIQKKMGRFTGFAGYTLSWNRRQANNVNNGDWYYARYDHRHDFKVTANYRLNNKHFDVSATWVFATGTAVTVPVSRYAADVYFGRGYSNGVYTPSVQGGYIDEYRTRGNYRMQPYHRLDLNVNYTFTKGAVEHKASIGLYNAYDRLNPFYIQYDYNRLEYKSVSLFPIMPAASYSVKF
jgi:outer membrane receptor for ferrienterochelin and colicin